MTICELASIVTFCAACCNTLMTRLSGDSVMTPKSTSDFVVLVEAPVAPAYPDVEDVVVLERALDLGIQ